MKKTLLAVAILAASTSFAQAVTISGSVGADTKNMSYGVDQSKGKDFSANAALSAELVKGLSVNAAATQVTVNGSNLKENANVQYGTSLSGVGVKGEVGTTVYQGAVDKTRDFKYGKLTVSSKGAYAVVEKRNARQGAAASATFYTLGYAESVTPKLTVGAEATERKFAAADVTKFNDVAIYGKYALTKAVDVVGTVAKAKRAATADTGSVTSVGVRYKF